MGLAANVSAGAAVTVSDDGGRLMAQFSEPSLPFRVSQSAVSCFGLGKAISTLDALLSLVVNNLLLPLLNTFGASGLPLPSISGITLKKTRLSTQSHYLLLGTQFKMKSK